MKKINNKWEEYSDEEWEFLASCLSGENNTEHSGEQISKSVSRTAELWRSMEQMRAGEEKEADTNKAWGSVYNRLLDNNLIPSGSAGRSLFRRKIPLYLRIAASIILIAGMGWTGTYLLRERGPAMMLVETDADRKNLSVELPDGSRVVLNHDTRLRYPETFSPGQRKVELVGEAFFEIDSDPANPFIIDAGKATIKVLGTSFNVNTSNSDKEVEVYVKSGVVLFAATNSSENLSLEEGFMGITNNGSAERVPGNNPNYMAWNSGILIYTGTRLETVFKDLYSVYGIEISVTDPSIYEHTITTVFERLTDEELIKIISSAFNLSWSKKGREYVISP